MEKWSVIYNIDIWYTNLYMNYQTLVLVFWGIILSIIFSLIVFLIKKRNDNGKDKISLYAFKSSDKTDLDVLYDVLKSKKQLQISTIAKSFNVDEKIVYTWGEILESGDLAIIDYPSFGKPIIRIQDDEDKKISIPTNITKDLKLSKSKKKHVIKKSKNKKKSVSSKVKVYKKKVSNIKKYKSIKIKVKKKIMKSHLNIKSARKPLQKKLVNKRVKKSIKKNK